MIDWSVWPVGEIIPPLKSALIQHPVVLVQAPPGAGKSTILPLALLQEPAFAAKRIIMLQPRRIAARSVAMRLAGLLGEEPGGRVGYRIRFEGKEGPLTRLLVVTEGILVRMLQQDPALEDTGIILFDEFHERSLHADLSFLLAREAQRILRPDLRLVVMSATLEGDRLSSVLKAPVLVSEGRQFPVKLEYTGLERQQPVPVQMAAVIRRACRETKGDILAFLPGTSEIQKTRLLLEESDTPARVVCLYGDLPFREQQQAILPDPDGMRRIVLATSIAETSLTIEGISTVVDSGLARIPRFDPASGLTRLVTVPVTRAAADQRAGRAGRLGPGVCYRLWESFRTASLTPARVPEILDADLASLVLELSAWGIADPLELDWIDPPPRGHVEQAFDLLRQLKAFDHRRSLTELGKRMVTLPTHPRLAHMLLAAKGDTDQASLACDLAAILEERDPLDRSYGADVRLRLESLIRHRKGERPAGDRHALDRIERLSALWRRMIKVSAAVTRLPDAAIEGTVLSAAYPDRIGRRTERNGKRYKLANGRMLTIDQYDPLSHSEWLVAAVADIATGEGRIFMAGSLDPDTLAGTADQVDLLSWDEALEQVTAHRQTRLGDLILSSRNIPVHDKTAATELLIGKIQEQGLDWCQLSDASREWQARLMTLKAWDPEAGWPDMSDASLLESSGKWLRPWLEGLSSRQALGRLDWRMMLESMLTYDQRQYVDRLVPAQITVPSGSHIRLKYFGDARPPELHVRLQEVFGWMETPRLMNGRQPVMMHLLSPAFRPVQITADLKSFWANTYQEVRKELRARYPKHAWPEDPFTAQAVRGARRRA